ncbi:hypothetical protein EGW08_020120 [Elysia chlorotica]|uniref:Uncharacterized protein n=1 Tax=Elysia chlorotica TaxID=188477 RepID=A0A433SS70_ELYCH|nr:hypothetical protein EGW08_020120 [Elysia chlorotica]
MGISFFTTTHIFNQTITQPSHPDIDLDLDLDLDLYSGLDLSFFQHKPNQSVDDSYTKDVLNENIDNNMIDYTFYKKETHLMRISNIASACFLVVGVVSNALALEVLNTVALDRTSFRTYMQWVCSYHLVSLMLSIIRQQTLLLDFEDIEGDAASSRFLRCAGMLWANMEIDHCINASLLLLVWNRIRAQRNLDKTDSEVSALRNPILLNVSALLLAMAPTSSYIKAYIHDAQKYNMTMCSFSFIHMYGSPNLQVPQIYRVVAVEEMLLFASLVILLVEIILRAIRDKRAHHWRLPPTTVRLSDEIYPEPSESELSNAVSGMLDYTMPSIYKARVKTATAARSTPDTSTVSSIFDEMWNKSMSSMTVVYMVTYFFMGMPKRILPYFLFHRTEFPLIMIVSLLRQAFQAGTLLFLYMGSKLIRHTVTDLTAQLNSMQYTSSSNLFAPNLSKKSRSNRWFDASSKSTAWSESTAMAKSSIAIDHRLPSMTKSMRATFAAEKAYENRSVNPSLLNLSLRMDRIELGLDKNEIIKRPTIVLAKKSQLPHISHESIAGQQNFFWSGKGSDV